MRTQVCARTRGSSANAMAILVFREKIMLLNIIIPIPSRSKQVLKVFRKVWRSRGLMLYRDRPRDLASVISFVLSETENERLWNNKYKKGMAVADAPRVMNKNNKTVWSTNPKRKRKGRINGDIHITGLLRHFIPIQPIPYLGGRITVSRPFRGKHPDAKPLVLMSVALSLSAKLSFSLSWLGILWISFQRAGQSASM